MEFLELFERYVNFIFPNPSIDIEIIEALKEGPRGIRVFCADYEIDDGDPKYDGVLCLIVIYNQMRRDFDGNDFETTFIDNHMNLCLYHLGLFESHGNLMKPLKEVLNEFVETFPNKFCQEGRERLSCCSP